jgi:hypothetical protein
LNSQNKLFIHFQFLAGAKGEAAAALVQDGTNDLLINFNDLHLLVLGSPFIFNFQEFLAFGGIQALAHSHPKHFATLNLFSYGM